MLGLVELSLITKRKKQLHEQLRARTKEIREELDGVAQEHRWDSVTADGMYRIRYYGQHDIRCEVMYSSYINEIIDGALAAGNHVEVGCRTIPGQLSWGPETE